MHLLGNLKKLLGYGCVLLVCTSLSFARSHKKATHPSNKATASRNNKGKGSSRVAKSKARGQQGIQSDRVAEIQQALIREHYLQGEASGVWDQRTKEAMTRLQGDNGWQTTLVPDSRALIKLGLGPKHADLINPDTAVNSPLAGSARGDMQGEAQR